jgi:threonine dehydratase
MFAYQTDPEKGSSCFRSNNHMEITVKQIELARKKLAGVIAETPLQLSKRLSQKYGATIYLKREDLQDVRSYKIRGAYNKMASLSKEEQKRGVVTASAGNHAQGVAYSCSLLKIHGVIFMPTITPAQKINKVRQFGGTYVEIQLVGTTFDEASAAAQTFCKEKNAVYVPPFNDPFVIAGQGTVGVEIEEAIDGNLDVIVAPIGGGGLI